MPSEPGVEGLPTFPGLRRSGGGVVGWGGEGEEEGFKAHAEASECERECCIWGILWSWMQKASAGCWAADREK